MYSIFTPSSLPGNDLGFKIFMIHPTVQVVKFFCLHNVQDVLDFIYSCLLSYYT